MTAIDTASQLPAESVPASDLTAPGAPVSRIPLPAPSDPGPGAGGVSSGRERIDALDAEIAELVLRRIEVSRQIQASRIADGGRRVDLRRETEIIARYSSALGRPGTAIAMALLELGRGRA